MNYQRNPFPKELSDEKFPSGCVERAALIFIGFWLLLITVAFCVGIYLALKNWG